MVCCSLLSVQYQPGEVVGDSQIIEIMVNTGQKIKHTVASKMREESDSEWVSEWETNNKQYLKFIQIDTLNDLSVT